MRNGNSKGEPNTGPPRFKDRFLAVVAEWEGGCLWCGEEETVDALPGSGGALDLPLCAKHVRWAMAARREGIGKQTRILRGLLFAWCRLKGGDRALTSAWLAGASLEGRARPRA